MPARERSYEGCRAVASRAVPKDSPAHRVRQEPLRHTITGRVAVVRLTVVPNDLEAEVVCGLLRNNGIRCFHRKSDMAAGIGDGSYVMAGPTEILVADTDLVEARDLLTDK